MKPNWILQASMAAWLCVLLLVGCELSPASLEQALRDGPPDRKWSCNAELENARSFTIPHIGAGQGLALVDHKLYFYGDNKQLGFGVIHEYDLDIKPTDRTMVLTENNKPRLTHPTGIAYLDKNNVFIGDTVNQQAKIYLIDWEVAWQDGNLNRAIKHEIEDDLAVNGCRPIVVSANRRRWIATSDYGPQGNEIRLYDPERLATSKRTSEQGVLYRRFSCGPFNQNLAWDGEKGHLIGVQNVVAGRGWRLESYDLDQALAQDSDQSPDERDEVEDSTETDSDRSKTSPAIRLKPVHTLTFPPHTELEGYRILPSGRAAFVTAHDRDNLWIGKIRTTADRKSPKGFALPYLD